MRCQNKAKKLNDSLMVQKRKLIFDYEEIKSNHQMFLGHSSGFLPIVTPIKSSWVFPA